MPGLQIRIPRDVVVRLNQCRQFIGPHVSCGDVVRLLLDTSVPLAELKERTVTELLKQIDEAVARAEIVPNSEAEACYPWKAQPGFYAYSHTRYLTMGSATIFVHDAGGHGLTENDAHTRLWFDLMHRCVEKGWLTREAAQKAQEARENQ